MKVIAVGVPDFVKPLGRQIVGWPVRLVSLQVVAADVAVDLLDDLAHLAHEQRADAVGPEVLDGRDEPAPRGRWPTTGRCPR